VSHEEQVASQYLGCVGCVRWGEGVSQASRSTNDITLVAKQVPASGTTVKAVLVQQATTPPIAVEWVQAPTGRAHVLLPTS